MRPSVQEANFRTLVQGTAVAKVGGRARLTDEPVARNHHETRE